MNPLVVAKIPATRSNPIPVSTCLAASGEKVPSAFALNWMKTWFQISMQRGEPALTSFRPSASPSEARRLTLISEQGPQGPVSPIIQKLSFFEPRTMWVSGSRPAFLKMPAQMSCASLSNSEGSPFSLSGEYTVAKILFGGTPHTLVTSSQPQARDSFLK